MEWFAPLLPVTVIAAIALFLVKEAVEGFRRWQANARKGQAFRLLLARECELNHWAYKRLHDALSLVQAEYASEDAKELAIRRTMTGDVVFQHGTVGAWHEWPLPKVHTDQMSKFMLDVATLDPSLFAHLEAAYDSVINLNHVRDSLIRYVESEREHLEGFVEYGLSELEDALADWPNSIRNVRATS